MKKANSHDQYFFASDNRLSPTLSTKGNRFLLDSTSSRLNDYFLTSTTFIVAYVLSNPEAFRFLHTLNPESVEVLMLKKKALVPEKLKVNKCWLH